MIPGALGHLEPLHHNCWAHTLWPSGHNYWACVSQLLKLKCLQPVLHDERDRNNEKPVHLKAEWPPLSTSRASPCPAIKTQGNSNSKRTNLFSSQYVVATGLMISSCFPYPFNAAIRLGVLSAFYKQVFIFHPWFMHCQVKGLLLNQVLMLKILS